MNTDQLADQDTGRPADVPWIVSKLASWRRSISQHVTQTDLVKPLSDLDRRGLALLYEDLAQHEDHIRWRFGLPASGPYPDWLLRTDHER